MEERIDVNSPEPSAPAPPPGAPHDAAPEEGRPPEPEAPSFEEPDDDALAGTRFAFGGRRPYAFTPPRVASPPAHRALPGVGTVALGRVIRVAPFGAFVDFLGFRGLVHISQLMPGYRVERVEDVVQMGDEVQVRVIGVDPERRHINLALVAAAPPAAAPPRLHPTPTDRAASPPKGRDGSGERHAQPVPYGPISLMAPRATGGGGESPPGTGTAGTAGTAGTVGATSAGRPRLDGRCRPARSTRRRSVFGCAGGRRRVGAAGASGRHAARPGKEGLTDYDVARGSSEQQGSTSAP